MIKYIWFICWGIWVVFFIVGVMFLICIVGVVNWIVCFVGIVDIRFILGVMCRMLEIDLVGVVIVNWGVVFVCIFVKDEVVILMGINFWSCIGIVCLFGEFFVLGVMCCLFVNGCIWIKVYVILLVELEFVCVFVRVVFFFDKGVSLMGLLEMIIKGGFDWVVVVIVFVIVVVIVVVVKKS